MKTLISILLILSSLSAWAQGFAGKTNEIYLDNKNNAKATVENLPNITWLRPSIEYTNSQENQIEIEALVSSVLPIEEVRVKVSATMRGDLLGTTVIKPEEIVQTKFKKKIHLFDGQNNIEIIVENSKGGIVSSTRIVTVGMDAIADAMSIDRKDYALMFAVDKYENWDDLVNPVNDAQTLKKELSEKYGFAVDLVENPDQEDVWGKIVDYTQKKYKPQDQLFIFFAGHGYFDETLNEGYAVARNSLKNDKGKSSYVSYERLRSLVNNIPCEHIFLVMDVCFGGTFDPTVARSRGGENTVTDKQYLARKLTYKTRRFLTSGGKEYVPDGRPGHHSPFAAKLILALKEGGGTDRILTLDEIKAYVEKLTPEPRFGGFGDNNASSDFLFVNKH
ncbi:MAG: caspase family protein [Bacteroidota bacterium]